MNNVDRQAQMMDYLYGEMTDQARREYELWLDQNPDAQKEIDDMHNSRQWLGEVEDINPRPLVVELPQKPVIDRRWLYRVAAAAAAVLVLWLFNFQIRTDRGGLILSFGNPESFQAPKQNIAQATETIPAEVWEKFLAENRELIEDKLMSIDSSWEDRFASLEYESRQQWQRVNSSQQRQVTQIRKEFTESELPKLAGLMQQMQFEQQEELQLLLVEFWNTWQETRQTDLERIDYKMTNLYQNVERNQQASEARVVDYIQNVAGK